MRKLHELPNESPPTEGEDSRIRIVPRRELVADPRNIGGGFIQGEAVIEFSDESPVNDSQANIVYEAWMDFPTVKAWYENVEAGKEPPQCIDGIDSCTVCGGDSPVWRTQRGYAFSPGVGRGDGLRRRVNGQKVEITQFKLDRKCLRRTFLLANQYENALRKKELVG